MTLPHSAVHDWASTFSPNTDAAAFIRHAPRAADASRSTRGPMAVPESHTRPFPIDWRGPVVSCTLFFAVALCTRFLVTIPNPGVILLLGVTFATFVGGPWTGILSAALLVGLGICFTYKPYHCWPVVSR
jgi:hypothetical protein